MNASDNLNEEKKKFISENYKSLSDKQIGRKLGISKKTVHSYRKQMLSGDIEPEDTDKNDKTTANPLSSKTKKISVILFCVIMLFAVSLRKHTFNLPHYRGDQHHYVGLAFKLESKGIEGYNLRGIDMYGSKKHPHLVALAPAQDKGHIIKSLAQAGITYYDEPLHHMPFGFPLALMISHKIFAPESPYNMLAINDVKIIKEAPPGVGLRNFRFDPEISGKQFYAIIVPFAFSLLLIFLIYYLAKILYEDEYIALTAMFMISISPIEILTSQKIWADEMTVSLATLAALLYIIASKKNIAVLALLGGLSCGFSVITKQNGSIIAIAIIGWHFLSNIDRLFKKESFLKVIFDKNLILFGLGCVLSSGYWFYKITSVYGDLIYKPHQQDLLEASKTGWFKMVQSRPKHLYLLGIPYQNPLFALAYLSPLWLLIIDKKKRKNLLFTVIWLAASFIVAYNLMAGEHRYMLPAYPAFAILGSYVANKFRRYLDKKAGFHIGTALLIIALIVSAFWSVPMVYETIFNNGALIMKPF